MGFSLGGLVGGALAGGGQAAGEVFQGQIDKQNKLDFAKEMAEIDQKRAMWLEQYKAEAATRSRGDRAARIDTAKQGLIDTALGEKYADANAANAGLTDSPLTPEQQAVINQAKAKDRAGLDNTDTYIQAATKTGDIEPKDVLSSNTRSEIAQTQALARSEVAQMQSDSRMAMLQEKIATQMKIAEMSNATAAERIKAYQEVQMAKLELAQHKADKSNDKQAAIDKNIQELLHDKQRDMRERGQAMSGIRAQMKNAFGDEKEALNGQLKELEAANQADVKFKQRALKELSPKVAKLFEDENPAPAAPTGGGLTDQSGAETSRLNSKTPVTTTAKPTGTPQPKSQAEFNALPKGTVFVAPDGTRRVK